MAATNPTKTYVFSVVAVRRAASGLARQAVHEHFTGYLAILESIRVTGANQVSLAAITAFHDRYLSVLGDDAQRPYLSPFRSRGYGKLVRINRNVAGSYAPSSLRTGTPLGEVIKIEGVRQNALYSLRKDHARIAHRALLMGKYLPVVALTAFLFRDYGFQIGNPTIDSALAVFRDRFGLRDDVTAEAQTFNELFEDDKAAFSDADLSLIRRREGSEEWTL